MVTHRLKRNALTLAITGVLLGSGFYAMPEAKAEGFVDDSTLTGVFTTGNVSVTVKMSPLETTKPT